MNSATYPPLFLDDEPVGLVDSTAGSSAEVSSTHPTDSVLSRTDRPLVKGNKVNIPSIHLQGSIDPWRPESVRLRADFYDELSSSVIEFAGGHQLPVAERDTNKVVVAIRQNSCSNIGALIGCRSAVWRITRDSSNTEGFPFQRRAILDSGEFQRCGFDDFEQIFSRGGNTISYYMRHVIK